MRRKTRKVVLISKKNILCGFFTKPTKTKRSIVPEEIIFSRKCIKHAISATKILSKEQKRFRPGNKHFCIQRTERKALIVGGPVAYRMHWPVVTAALAAGHLGASIFTWWTLKIVMFLVRKYENNERKSI